MDDIMSQNEIDSLLAALKAGELDVDNIIEEEERTVKNYDFNRPAKFSKEHLRTLEIIFEHYGRLISTNLPVYLRKNVQVTVSSSETVAFSEYSNALAIPVILGIINFAPLNGSILMELSTNLGYAVIDRLLGGAGEPLDKTREFSEIETTILVKIVTMFTTLLREPWKNVIEITPVLSRLETNPQFAQVVPPTDMVAIVSLSIKIGKVEGYVNFCLPYLTLEDVMDKLNTKYWYSTMQESHDIHYEEYIEGLLKRVEVPIKTILGTSTISVADFSGLQVGDCIRLDQRIDDELAVYVGNIKKFLAVPGSKDDFYAARVTTILHEE